jgi:hypothetical protein
LPQTPAIHLHEIDKGFAQVAAIGVIKGARVGGVLQPAALQRGQSLPHCGIVGVVG